MPEDDPPSPEGTLLERTRELLRADERSLHDLAIASGLPFYWLRKIHGNEIKDPGVNRIQRLYEFLTSQPLTVQ